MFMTRHLAGRMNPTINQSMAKSEHGTLHKNHDSLTTTFVRVPTGICVPWNPLHAFVLGIMVAVVVYVA